jgi:hypothetical protein
MRRSWRGYWLVGVVVVFVGLWMLGLAVLGLALWACYQMVKSLQTRLSAAYPLGARGEILLVMLGLYRGVDDGGLAGVVEIVVLYLIVRMALEPCRCWRAEPGTEPQKAENGTCSTSQANNSTTTVAARVNHVKL